MGSARRLDRPLPAKYRRPRRPAVRGCDPAGRSDV